MFFSISISNQESPICNTTDTSENVIESTGTQNKNLVGHSVETDKSEDSPDFPNIRNEHSVGDVSNTTGIDNHTSDFTSVWNQYEIGSIPNAAVFDYTNSHSKVSSIKQNVTETICAHDIPHSDSTKYRYTSDNCARTEMKSDTTLPSKKKDNKHSLANIIRITNAHHVQGTTPPSTSAQNKYIVDNISEGTGKGDNSPQYTTPWSKSSTGKDTETCSNNGDSSIAFNGHAERTNSKDEIISLFASVSNKHCVGNKLTDGNVSTSLNAHVGNITKSADDTILVSTYALDLHAVGDVAEIDNNECAAVAMTNLAVQTERTASITSSDKRRRERHSGGTKHTNRNSPTSLSAHSKYYVANVAETETIGDAILHSTSAQNTHSENSEIPNKTLRHASNPQNKYCIGNIAEIGTTNDNSTTLCNKGVLRTGSTGNTTLHPTSAWCKHISMNTTASTLVDYKSTQRKYTMTNIAEIESSESNLTRAKNKYVVGDVIMECESTDDGQGTENTDFSILQSANEENRYYVGNVLEVQDSGDTIPDSASALYKNAVDDVTESTNPDDAVGQLTIAPNKFTLRDASKYLTISHSRHAQNKYVAKTKSSSTSAPNKDAVKSTGIGNYVQHSANAQDKCVVWPESISDPLTCHTNTVDRKSDANALNSKCSMGSGADIEHLEESIPETVSTQNKRAKKTRGNVNKYAIGNDGENADVSASDSMQMDVHGKGL